MTLDEFAVDFIESALISVEGEGLNPEDAVTKDILEYIKDCGEILDPQVCNFKIRGMKINAIDYDDDNETIDLFITIFKEEARIQKVSDKDVLDAFKKVESFFIAAKNGIITEKIEEPDEHISDFIEILQHTKSYVRNVRVFVLTNGLCSAHIVPSDKEDDSIIWDYELWDIERIYQQYLIKSGKQKIEIDFQSDYNFRLKCLQMDNVSEKVEEYLTILPASILADIYGKFKQGLLEKNVRTFLQFKAKVNNGIRDTIRTQPDMFFAYNNGISTTAEKVEITYDNGFAYLSRVENLQIVNGGQTTASIYYTSGEKGIDLSKVFVQMKISVVKPGNSLNDIIPNISQFANSQTAIKASDFSSNSPYQVSIERWSRSEWIAGPAGGKSVSKWYYERTRGQYLDERSRIPSAKDQKRFDIEYPKRQKFTKTDLAKFEMCWWQRPHDASKGGEKNYLLFLKEIDQNVEISKTEYQHLLSKAILFHEIDKMVAKSKLGGYKANVVSYTVSLLSEKTGQRLNLDQIWQQQSLNEELLSMIEIIVPVVWQHITEPPKQGMNVTEWCKRLECWNSLKGKYIDVSALNNSLLAYESVIQTLNEYELKMIDEASGIKGENWFIIAKWAKENNLLTPFDRKLAYNLGVLHSRRVKLSIKQAKNAIRIFKEASELGCAIEQ